MTNRFDRSLRLGYSISLMILLVVSTVSYFTLQNLLKSNQAVEHSGQVMQRLEKVLSVMKDAETGQRGYLLSGKSNYLEPYNGAYHEAQLLTDQLISLTSGNRRQQSNISAIKTILAKRLTVLQQLVEKKTAGRTDCRSGS